MQPTDPPQPSTSSFRRTESSYTITKNDVLTTVVQESASVEYIRLRAGDTLTVGTYVKGVPNELIITEEWLHSVLDEATKQNTTAHISVTLGGWKLWVHEITWQHDGMWGDPRCACQVTLLPGGPA